MRKGSVCWDISRTQWQTGGLASVTSNYDGATRIFAGWTVGTDSLYAVQFATILIPEKLFLFIDIAPLIPLLLRRKRKADVKNRL